MTYFGKHKTDREELITLQELENKIDQVESYQERRDETAAELTKRMASRGKPAVHRGALPTSQAAPVSAVKITSAAEFGTKQMTMVRSEFDKLTPADKSRFFREGGSIATVEPAKPHSVKGVPTRAGLQAMTPDQRMAHFKSGGTLAD